MKLVITGFTDNIEDNKYGTGQSDGQAGYINHIERFVLANAPDSNSKKILPHIVLLFLIFILFIMQANGRIGPRCP